MSHSEFNQTTIFFDKDSVQECRDLYQAQGMSISTIAKFKELVYLYYQNNERKFSWRTKITPYHVVVSEIMLQQTQTHRVADKFDAFITVFPTFAALATAPFEEVLRLWKGLGYNRRALNLQKIALRITLEYDQQLPNDPELLVTLPGIGKATAASICAFAFNKPTVFIETNIRTVFIYLFFSQETNIHDNDIIPLIAQTVDQTNPRDWYYGLMDYGVMLKKTIGNFSRLSKHHTKQSTFKGSDRQIRGLILQALLDTPGITEYLLIVRLNKEENRVLKMLDQLKREGFIQQQGKLLLLS